MSAEDFHTYIPYAHMFPMALPFAPFMQCYNCLMSDKTEAGGNQEKKEKKRTVNIGNIMFYFRQLEFYKNLSVKSV